MFNITGTTGCTDTAGGLTGTTGTGTSTRGAKGISIDTSQDVFSLGLGTATAEID